MKELSNDWIQVILGLLVLLLGLPVFIEWYTSSNLLENILPSYVSMRFASALGMVFSGCGLIFLKRVKYVSGLFGLGLICLGLITLYAYIFKVFSGIDASLLDYYILHTSAHCWEMTPNTSVCFALVGISYLIVEFYGQKTKYLTLAYVLLIITGLFAFLAIFGFLSGLAREQIWAKMSIHTGIGFILISIASALLLWQYSHKSQRKNGLFIATLFGVCSFLLFSLFSIAFKSNEIQRDEQISKLQGNVLSDKIKNTMDESYENIEGTLGLLSQTFHNNHSVLLSVIKQQFKRTPYIEAFYLDYNNQSFPIKSYREDYLNLKVEKIMQRCRNYVNDNKTEKTHIVTSSFYNCIFSKEDNSFVVINLETLLNSLWSKQYLIDNFGVKIQRNNITIFKKDIVKTASKEHVYKAQKEIEAMGIMWNVTYYLDATYFQENQIELPVLFFTFGLIISLIMVMLVRSKQVSYYRLESLKKTYNALKRAESKLKYMVKFDQLTDIANRGTLLDSLKKEIKRAHRQNENLAILFVDIDNFKNVNDIYGHHVGDLLLKSVANRLCSVIRGADYIARLSGDEFSIILTGFKNINGIEIGASRCIEVFKKPIEVEGKKIDISVSIGISVYPYCGKTPDELIQKADSAMYRAKEKGKNNFVVYSEKLHKKLNRKHELEQGLKKALENEEFYLVYQPQFDIQTQKICGVEALIRWENKQLNFPEPDEFIPLAEMMHIIKPIGHWVIEQAISDYQHIDKKLSFQDVNLAINVSTIQLLDRTFLQTFEEIFYTKKIKPEKLTLEVTETTLIKNITETKEMLINLSAKGIKIALDDFGTGYSSMYYLKTLPVSCLKIDKGFIADINQTKASNTLIEGMVLLAKSLGLSVIAEGVETESQLNFLKKLPHMQFQGYLYARPLRLKELFTFFDDYTNQQKGKIIDIDE